MKRSLDKPFLASVLILAIAGFFIFTSASLGLLAREGAGFGSVTANQVAALAIGLVALYVSSKIPYTFWKKNALWIFSATILANLLLFVPGIGFHHGGATRWLAIGPFSLQPSEFLKIGFIIYFAAWLGHVKDKSRRWKYGLVPLLVILALLGPMLVLESDTKTFAIIVFAGLSMLFVAGTRLRDIFILILLGFVFIGSVAYVRPYARERIMTFLNPASDPLNSGYQIQQSLIAIGSGKMFGRGFGQSIQKFNYLPEPIGDSIFAVYAEEWGFAGCTILLALFLMFAFRGFKIAARTEDAFGSFVTIGIIILIVSESFMNIAAMLGVIPLSGMPLIFVSHGGTALITAMAEAGIILNVSRSRKKTDI